MFFSRDFKDTVYEGGTKVPAFIHFGSNQLKPKKYENLFHSVDILPTLLSAATNNAIKKSYLKLDGVSHWNHLKRGNSNRNKSPRNFMVYNIDDTLVPEIYDVVNRTVKFQVGKCIHMARGQVAF